MPWQRVRKDYDHHRDHRKRLIYRLDVSILVATALLCLTLVFAVYPVLGNADPAALQSDTIAKPQLTAGPPLLQELCVGIAALCVAYLAVALFLRSRP